MKHTPGPWEVLEVESVVGGGWDIVDEKGNSIFTDNNANARLIASAPELLEACKKAVQFLDDGNDALEFRRPYQYKVWKKCLQAIAKAESEA